MARGRAKYRIKDTKRLAFSKAKGKLVSSTGLFSLLNRFFLGQRLLAIFALSPAEKKNF